MADNVAERERLIQQDRDWMTAASSGQYEKALTYFSDQATVMPPGVPVAKGRAAVDEMIRSLTKIPGFKIDWRSDEVHVSDDGTMGYCVGSNRVTVSGPDGKPATTQNRLVTIWRKEEDGQWRCVLDFWAPGPELSPAE